MEGMTRNPAFLEFLHPHFVSPFTLIDVGCSSGIDRAWRMLGSKLRAIGFDPNLAEVERLNAKETHPGVHFIAGFVGVPHDHPLASMNKHLWSRSPWQRLSTSRLMEQREAGLSALNELERTQLNLWPRVTLADPEKPIFLPDYFRDENIYDIDFVKIDVDGADFLVLRSIETTLSSANVLGVGIEVNYFGTERDTDNTFHNVDRLMRQAGFELFNLTVRRYSTRALPAKNVYLNPSQTIKGRPFQGDALYIRDLANEEFSTYRNQLPIEKLAKLLAIFALFDQQDSAAELIMQQRNRFAEFMDVGIALDILARQWQESDQPHSYNDYMHSFETNPESFFPARR